MKDHGFVYELSIRLLPPLLTGLMRLWFSTCRIVNHDKKYLTDLLDAKRPVIATTWHYSLLMALWPVRHYSAAIMVSSSRDGEYTARLVKRFGFLPVRGSRHRKGVAALKELMKLVAAGHNCGLIADGSQGPPLVAQPGCLLLSARCGAPIVPIVCSTNRYWTIRSWDRTVLPKPFARIEVFFGEPFTVSVEADGAIIEEYRQLLEKRMLELYRTAWRQQGKEGH